MAGAALVTGATGFVGGRLVSLVQADWEVRGMVRDRAGSLRPRREGL
jgi:nucleoside-diphosphate-sugar epimerase